MKPNLHPKEDNMFHALHAALHRHGYGWLEDVPANEFNAEAKMTMRYAHISPDHTRAAMETLEQRFSAKSPADFHNTPHTTTPLMEKKIVAFH